MESRDSYETVDHTADFALRVRAADLSGLFRTAGRGLASLLAGPGGIRPAETWTLQVSGVDLEELLVAWLNEIIFRAETEATLFLEFEDLRILRGADGFRLESIARGERYDDDRHAGGIQIKAATYHGLQIRPDSSGGYDVTIVFDR